MPNHAADPKPDPKPDLKTIPNPRGNQTLPQTNQPSPTTKRSQNGRFTPPSSPTRPKPVSNPID